MTQSVSRSQAQGAVARATRRKAAREPRVAALIAVTLSGLVVAAIALASVTQVPEVIRAPGMIVPAGNYQQVETMEGGVVRSVNTAEGETVAKGALLAELVNPELSREARTMDQELLALATWIANHRAVLELVVPGVTVGAQAVSQLEHDGLSHAAVQSKIYRASQSIQATTIEQMTETVRVLEGALDFATERAAAKEADLELAESLHERGLTPLRELQARRDAADDMRAEEANATVRLAQSEQDLRVAIAHRDDEALKLREDQLSQLQDLEREYDTISVARAALQERLDALRITAPTAGVIQSVAYPNPGEVIARGETLFELLPEGQALVAEVRIPTIDIGHVGTGETVTVKVDTYDVRRFGQVQGEIIAISPAPVTDEVTGEDYYRASVRLDSSEIGHGRSLRTLKSGMTVVAERVTDTRTALAYLLKPVQRSLAGALGER